MDNNKKGFTIVELMVSIVISIILLGGIFYFLSDTINGIARSSSQAKFLKDFYSFTTILDTGETEILFDYGAGVYDVALLRNLDNTSGVILWVVDENSRRLVSSGSTSIYNKNYLWYRSVSQSELTTIDSTPEVVYSYDFFPDKLFYNFHLRDFQLQQYNSWATMDMNLKIFTEFYDWLTWKRWADIPQDDIYEYSVVF